MAAYLLLALVASVIPVRAEPDQGKEQAEVFILSNGVHTDLVIPVEAAGFDLSKLLPVQHTRKADSTFRYLGVGWGDKGFYLDTPTWAELKASTALKAMTGMGGSAMHVTWHQELRESESCRKVTISRKKYQRLLTYIFNSFKKGKNGRFIQIGKHSYGDHDAFYEANGSYSLFTTCNTWTNSGLRAAGMKACFWTPFDKGILYQYNENNP